RGLQAIRLSKIKSLASGEKVLVELTSNGKRLKALSKGKVDDYVVFVDEVLEGNALSKLNDILAKPNFSGSNGLFNKLKVLPSTTNRTENYASIETFRDEFIRLHGLNNSGVNSIDNVLNDFDNLVTNYSNVPNVEKYVDELMQSQYKFKGGSFGLEILNDLPPALQGKTLTKFEASIDDLDDLAGGCRFDLQFSDGTKLVYIETKNYAKTTAFSNS